MRARPSRGLLLTLLFVISACAAPSAPGSAPTDAPGTSFQGQAAAPSGPKILRIGAQREPDSFLRPGSQGQERIWDLAHAQLAVPNERADFIGRLATEIPSVERGTWVINPDGTMDTTWRLRPNIRWHDGRAMSADDLVFAFELHQNRNFIVSAPRPLRFMDSVEAPDPQTFVIHWKQTFALAFDTELMPYPRHILGGLADDTLERLHNSPHWTTEFIGLGPYRLVRWEAGSHLEFARFDDYSLGRPRLDSVFYRFYPDVNTLIANILSGAVDLHLPVVLEAQQALEIQRHWEGTGHRVMVGPDGRPEFLSVQLRPDSEVMVRPSALRDQRVRQALYRAIDREEIAAALFYQYAQTSDSWIPPNDPRRQVPVIREAIQQYPYDPARAQRELEELGWRRGADGILANAAGERFEFEIRDTPTSVAESKLNITRDMFKRVGVEITPLVVSPQRTADREYRSLHPGWEFTSTTYVFFEITRLHTSDIGTPTNRYAGGNKGGYSNPQMDALVDRLAVTIPPDQRHSITADMLRIATNELPVLPLYWQVGVITAAAKVKNVLPPHIRQQHGWNLPDWDVEA